MVNLPQNSKAKNVKPCGSQEWYTKTQCKCAIKRKWHSAETDNTLGKVFRNEATDYPSFCPDGTH